MKRVQQNLNDGKIILAEVPLPSATGSEYLIKTNKTLISIGTEKMLMEFGNSNLIGKVLKQPERAKEVIQKIQSDGLFSAYEAVSSKLNSPLDLGYCNVGTIDQSFHKGYEIGARVISNGFHADFVSVSKNLVCRIPDNVDDESACFTVPASISLQGIRLLDPSIGENVVVFGLGLIGMLAVQILKANGCNVIAIDPDKEKRQIAENFGAFTIDASDEEELLTYFQSAFPLGVDGVLICASSPKNNIISQAATISRKRGKIILIGVVGLNLNRNDFYEKELSFQVSCSYGPGRYDQSYENSGHDFPYAYVRWTENRNFQAILSLMSESKINTKNLFSKAFDIKNVGEAYDFVLEKAPLGVILNYSNTLAEDEKKDLVHKSKINKSNGDNDINVSFIGAGNYASRSLLPLIKKHDVNFKNLISNGGSLSSKEAKKYDFEKISSQKNLLNSKDTNTLFITSRHDSHAKYVLDAIENNQNIWVEKPLAISIKELEKIRESFYKRKNDTKLVVGFNRRFSPHVVKIKQLLDKRKNRPKNFLYTINAGTIADDHWIHDPSIGGGRLIGEACHFVDLIKFLADSEVKEHSCYPMLDLNQTNPNYDSFIIILRFKDGSVGNISYFSNGSKNYTKERIEIFSDGSILQLDNFKKLKGFNWPSFSSFKTFKIEKGQKELISSFFSSIKENKEPPMDFEGIYESSRIVIDLYDRIFSK